MSSVIRRAVVAGIAIVVLRCLAPPASSAQGDPSLPAHLDEVRRASAAWDRRSGSGRQVVDMVCLVPDVATFLEAIATWDDKHYFPILIDDVEYTFKFLREFRPARVVRFARRADAIPDDQLWSRATAAVARAWVKNDADAPLRPAHQDGTAPGVVLSAPGSPMLAGAVALAAGRIQPLLSCDAAKHYNDVLSADEAEAFAAKIEDAVTRAGGGGHDRLGDDCDFITLAGDWPYRYNSRPQTGSPFDEMSVLRSKAAGPDCVDDLVGRGSGGRSRWAFVGRLIGDERLSVYRAMCGLFLQPQSALLLNTYDEKNTGWSPFAMHSAARRLERVLPVTDRSGESASLAGWHKAFDPRNPFGLVMINTHGEPTRFHVTDGSGMTADVPQSVPAVVLMIHSFSAADPVDPATIAGRWLANGAYVYFGSMQEPYLQAFRTPDLVAALIAEGMPLGAAMRQSPPEPFGRPWRLIYLGDPLYRVRTSQSDSTRVSPDAWPAAKGWPRYEHAPHPAPRAGYGPWLSWTVREAVTQLQRADDPAEKTDLARELLAIRRDRLDTALQPFYDALLADTLLHASRPGTLHTELLRIPATQRSAENRRLLETCQVLLIQQSLARGEFTRAEALWSEMVRSGASTPTLEQVTARVGTLANSPARRSEWREILVAAQRLLRDSPNAAVIENERKRVDTPR